MKKRRMQILCVANQKGGVTKSTTAAHLGFYAAGELGLRTLMLDLDEGSVSSVFDRAENDGKGLKASQLFEEKQTGQPRTVGENIDLIENDIALHNVDALSVDMLLKLEDELLKPENQFSLHDARAIFDQIVAPLDRSAVSRSLAQFSEQYDICIIDTPPNPSNRLLGALTAADAVITPMDLDKFTIDRIELFKRTLRNVQKDRAKTGRKLRMLGYLPSKVDVRSKKQLEHLEQIRARYGDEVMNEFVAVRSAIPAALNNGRAVWTKAKSGAHRVAAEEMRAACAAIFARFDRN